MSYSSRFWLYAPISLFMALAAAAMLHWWTLASALDKKLAAAKGREIVPGITADWNTVEVGGFPFRLDASFTKLKIAGAGAHGPFSWSTEKFVSHTLTYGSRKTVYEAAGQQRLAWADAAGTAHSANFLPGSLHASSILDDEGLRRMDIDAVDAGSHSFTIGRFQMHMRRDPDGKSIDLMLKADNWDKRKQVQVYATLPNAQAFMPLLKGEKNWADASSQWRAQNIKPRFAQVVAPGLDPDALLNALY